MANHALVIVKNQDLAELRHNLRTPINHILGYGEMMIEDATELGLEDCAKDLSKIHEDGKQLLAIINAALTPATNEVSELDLRALHRDLLPPLDKVIVRLRNVRLLAEDLQDSHPDAARVFADLNKIQTAAERLMSMAEEMVTHGPALHAMEIPTPASKVQPAPVTVLMPKTALPQTEAATRGHLLVVDDNDTNRDVLSRRLEREGYRISTAENGRQALEMVGAYPYDLVLLDIMMPEVDGYEVLTQMKADPALSDIPVVMISALDEIQSVVRCIETGAEDYLSKPFDPVLLRARIGASLEKKRLRDEQRRRTAELERAIAEAEIQRRESESLLRNILPAQIADELRLKGQVEPKYFEDVTIMFTDFVGFTHATENLAAEELVHVLHNYFTAFDRIVTAYGLEKLKTIGDSYMLAGGLPVRSPSHPVDVVLAAFELVKTVEQMECVETPWKVRIGIHTGPVIAGVVGVKKFAFDVWGESVNFSSRMESASKPNRINISSRTHSRVKDFFECENRGMVATKEGKEYQMHFATGILPKLLDGAGTTSPPPAFQRRYKVYFQKELCAFPEFMLQTGRARGVLSTRRRRLPSRDRNGAVGLSLHLPHPIHQHAVHPESRTRAGYESQMPALLGGNELQMRV